MNNQYVLEWSKKQGFFHIQELTKTIRANMLAFVSNKTLNDYHIILIGTYDEVTEAADRLRSELYGRDEQA